MKSTKRLSAALLHAAMFIFCFAMCFTAIGAEAGYAETAQGTCGDNLTWVLEDGTLTISGSGDMIALDEEDCYRPYYESITKVIVKPGVTSIGTYAFTGFRNLAEVSLPEGLTVIGDRAFEGCSILSKVVLPNSVQSIGWNSFAGCRKLETINFPDSLTTIDNYAFENCNSLTSAHLPDGLTYLGVSAFAYCSKLSSLTLPSKAETISEQAFYQCESLQSVKIPEGITTLDYGAFQDSGLIDITLPSTLKFIGERSFCNCPARQIDLPEGLEYIGEWAFEESGLVSVNIPASVKTMGFGPFTGCKKLPSITVDPANEKFSSVDGILFNKDGSALVNYPAGKTDAEYTIPEGVKLVQIYSFYLCGNLKSVTFPSSLKIVDESAFGSSGIESVDASLSGLTEIDDAAFSFCPSLKTILLPETLKSIGDYAFEDCEALTDVYYDGDETGWSKITIGSYNEYLSSATMHYGGEHRHSFGAWTVVKAATCIPGTEERVCSGCGAKETREIPAVSEHEPGEWIVAVKPAYGVPGKEEQHCKVCDSLLDQRTIPALEKLSNSLSVSPKAVKLKASKLKKKAQSLAAAKYITFSNRGQGAVTYKLSGVQKAKFKKFFKVNASTGKITVKKGLKKGTYNVTITVTASGNTSYKAGTKTVTFKVKVK